MVRRLPSISEFNRRALQELGWWRQDATLLARRAVQEFSDDRCTQIAAGISYYVFFSVFPLLIFLITAFGQILRNDSVKDRVVEAVMEVVPLAPEGQDQLDQILNGVAADISLLGLLSIIGLIWSASAMMGALRGALNVAWDTDHRRPAIQGKIVDILMVMIVGLLVALSVAATGARPYVQDQVTAIGDDLALLGALLGAMMWSLTYLVPVVVSFSIFSALYRFVPAVNTTFDEIWPGALFAAAAFELAKVGFSFYISNFADYNAVYGSLGAVIVFMLFIFIAANVLLMGAEIASEWPRVRAGHYDRGLPTRIPIARLPLGARLQALARQAVLGGGDEVEHVDDHEIEDRNHRRRQQHQRASDD